MNGSVCISPGWATIGPLKNHIFQMHCKTDAVNQVSLERSMKCEGLPPGRCAVLVQTWSSLEARFAVPGEHSTAARHRRSLTQTRCRPPSALAVLPREHPPAPRSGWAPACTSPLCCRNPNIWPKGRCRFTPRVTKTAADKFQHVCVASSARIKRRF